MMIELENQLSKLSELKNILGEMGASLWPARSKKEA